MKKLKILIFVCLLTFCGTAWAEKFPDLGECTGDYVRLRKTPDTKSEIIDQVNKGDFFILLDVKEVNGEKWYLIDNPTRTGNAWIFGKYVKKYYDLKDSEHTPAYVIAMQLRLDYGITPAKTRALYGKPLESVMDTEGFLTGLKYNGFELAYDEETVSLTNVSIGFEEDGKDSDKKFGPIKIGDTTKKLREVFGKYIKDEAGYWSVETPSGERMYFNIGDGKVNSMQWLIEEH